MMQFHNFTLSFRTKKREEFISIVDDLNKLISNSGAYVGSCKLYIPHTTAAIIINQNADPDILKDMTTILGDICPNNKRYLNSEGNSDAHFKSSLFGQSHEIPILDGVLHLGEWQGIFLCEFDGPRTRKVMVQILADGKKKSM